MASKREHNFQARDNHHMADNLWRGGLRKATLVTHRDFRTQVVEDVPFRTRKPVRPGGMRKAIT